MTPVPTPPDDPKEDFSLRRWLLMSLQVLAMALCACLIARFIVEDSFQLPRGMCIETPAPQ